MDHHGVAVLAFGGLLSLFEDEPDKATAEPKPSASARLGTDEPDEKPSAEPSKPSGIPSPSEVQTGTLILALYAVEPGLVADEDRAVDRARNVCPDRVRPALRFAPAPWQAFLTGAALGRLSS
ncbi:hypothetical protein ACIOEX_17000 [Streptomyces sp. NPDC087850]|uniref:hypothetical protein n=1 Tax=unclassified Streptomyces TaxID=2593676 RepID=UPI0037FDC677